MAKLIIELEVAEDKMCTTSIKNIGELVTYMKVCLDHSKPLKAEKRTEQIVNKKTRKVTLRISDEL